jgi:hypothetical protein
MASTPSRHSTARRSLRYAPNTGEAMSFWVSLMLAGSRVGAAAALASSTSPVATQPKRLVAPPEAPATKPAGASRCGSPEVGLCMAVTWRCATRARSAQAAVSQSIAGPAAPLWNPPVDTTRPDG